MRPGASVRVVDTAGITAGCTLNFLFAGSDGNRYIGTAGHCVFLDYGDDTNFGTTGGVATVDGNRIGQVAYGVHDYVRDFALIRLDAGVAASPDMMHFGGPTGLYTDRRATPSVLHHFGQLSATGTVMPGRTGVAPNTLSPYQVVAYSTGTWGDSGSGVIDSDGKAVGVLVTLGGLDFDSVVPAVGTNGLTRIDYQLVDAEQTLGITLTIETAPLRTKL